ncbi:hypothetical protein LCGC14_2542350 [marine sediment metagenome]|uniref:Uncharacterized protein n=1 Tax=marine sediment metagenome TaxID=412755 RepID=A0A0F9BD76_9ZZZZ
MSMTTDKPTPPARVEVSTDMFDRIIEGRLDYRRGLMWHDPRGFDAAVEFKVKQALSFTTS